MRSEAASVCHTYVCHICMPSVRPPPGACLRHLGPPVWILDFGGLGFRVHEWFRDRKHQTGFMKRVLVPRVRTSARRRPHTSRAACVEGSHMRSEAASVCHTYLCQICVSSVRPPHVASLTPLGPPGSRVWGVGCRAWGLEFGVWDLGFGVWDLGFGV